MAEDDPMLTDTRDMISVHEAFRRGLGDARGQLASGSDGDTERARRLADYLGELLWLLHAHHAGEDELMYPLLAQRVPDQSALFSRMDRQHIAVTSNLETAERARQEFEVSGLTSDGQELADACQSLLTTLEDHLNRRGGRGFALRFAVHVAA